MMRAIPFVLFILLAAACQAAFTSPTMKQSSKSAVIKGRALIDKVEVTALEKEPPAYRFKVYGSLPDSCTSIDQVTVNHRNNDWVVTITTTRPADKMCAAVIVPFERELSDVRPEDGSTGSIDVNGVKKSFP